MIDGIVFEDKAPPAGSQSSLGAPTLHFYAKQKDTGEVDVFFLKPNGTSTGIISETVSGEDFKARFKDCSAHDCQFRKKSEQEIKSEKIAKQLAIGLEHLEKNEFNSATFEFGKALKIDEKNIEAHFGKGKAHIALGEHDKALEHFDAMADNEELFTAEHKHTFNELGIELRKNKLFEEAIRNYEKAINLAPDDEALYYNLARALKEWGKPDEAKKAIQKALEISPDFKEATHFLKNLEG